MAGQKITVPLESSERLIFLVRGQRVMIDADFAELYGVETKALNRAFARNRERFPADFAFQLTEAEFDDLRCQFLAPQDGAAGDTDPMRLLNRVLRCCRVFCTGDARFK